MNWNDYEPFDPGVREPLQQTSRAAARAAYERLMSARRDRISALQRLAAANGIALDEGDAAIQRLDEWVRANVAADQKDPSRLHPMWYAVVNDIGIFLGEVMIARAPNLHWTFFTAGAKDAAYQRHVIMGFEGVPNPKYNVDVDALVAMVAHRAIQRLPLHDDEFVRIVRTAVARASRDPSVATRGA